jgi:hypothetical protein
MQIKIKILFTTLIMSLFFACSNDNEGDSVTPAYHQTYLRFVSPSGTNVLDSLHLLENGLTKKVIDDDLFSVSINRSSDGQSMDSHMSKYLFLASPRTDTIFKKDETLVRLDWNDFNIWDLEKRPQIYHEIYKISMRSPKIFGNKEQHSMNWYANVVGRTYDAYKCELDGQEISLENDPFYNKRVYDGRHVVSAIITILCENVDGGGTGEK